MCSKINLDTIVLYGAIKKKKKASFILTQFFNNKKVEKLLQAAQEEMLFKLSLNSHMSCISPQYLCSNLDHHYFQALKSRPSPSFLISIITTKIRVASVNEPQKHGNEELKFRAMISQSSLPFPRAPCFLSSFFFFNGKIHKHLMGLEPMTSPSTKHF